MSHGSRTRCAGLIAHFSNAFNIGDPCRFDLALVLGSVLAALIVAIGSTLGAVCAAAFGTSILAQVYGRRRRWVGPFPVLPVTALGLVPVYWLLVTASGPGGSSFRALTEAPISPAAEIVLTPPLLLASWGFLGLWPLSGLVPGAALAPIGGALLWRIGIELIPGGMAHWQPLIMPLAVAGVWQGAVLKRPATVLVGLGTLGLASLQSAGAVGGVCNLCIAAAVDVRNRFLGSRTPPAYVLTRLGWVVPAWAGLLVIDAALRAQVLYTVVACAGVAVALRPEAAARLS